MSTAAANISVTYGPGFPAAAQSAFAYAVSLWQQVISSPQPIRISVTWEPLGGALGNAGPHQLYPVNRGLGATYYPDALLDALTNVDHNPGQPDITAKMASDVGNWSFGTSGTVPAGQVDFVSTVMHELGHGLGFVGGMSVEGGLGQWLDPTAPLIFDRFVRNGAGTPITNFADNTLALREQLTGGDLFQAGPQTVAVLPGGAELYAPPSWGASSYSHLDETAFPTGGPNSLLTPILGTGEQQRDPGTVGRAVLADLGWTVTGLDVTPPDTTITVGPATGSTTANTTPTFEFTANENGSTFECSVDAASFTPCTSPFTTAVLSATAHTFAVRAVDALHNTDPSPATRTFTVAGPDPTATLALSPTAYTVAEGSTVTVTVTRTGSSAGTASVQYSTTTGTAGPADFTAASGTLTFPAGITSRTFGVTTTTDALVEGPESFGVGLTNPAGGGVVLGAATGSVSITDDPTVAGGYRPVTPARVLDTRVGTGAPTGAVTAQGEVHLLVSGVGGVPATGVSAVLLNLAVTGPSSPGYLIAHPDLTARPLAANLNFGAGQTVSNAVVVRVGSNGRIDLVNGQSSGSVHVIADVSGYFLGGTPASPGAFGSLTPARLLDTRFGTGAPTGVVTAGQTLDLTVAGQAGVPVSGASAVVLNVAVTAPTAAGYLVAYGNEPRPLAANLNFVSGQTVSNLVVAPVSSTGTVRLFNGQSSGSVHVIADISGYFLAGAATGRGAYGPVAPGRLLDSRLGTGAPTGAVAAGQTVNLTVAGRGGVPATGVSAVVLNVAVTAPTAAGYLVGYGNEPRPLAANLNFEAGQTVSNLVVAPVSSTGTVRLFNGQSSGSVHVIADVFGYFTGAAAAIAGPTVASLHDPAAGLPPRAANWERTAARRGGTRRWRSRSRESSSSSSPACPGRGAAPRPTPWRTRAGSSWTTCLRRCLRRW